MFALAVGLSVVAFAGSPYAEPVEVTPFPIQTDVKLQPKILGSGTPERVALEVRIASSLANDQPVLQGADYTLGRSFSLASNALPEACTKAATDLGASACEQAQIGDGLVVTVDSAGLPTRTRARLIRVPAPKGQLRALLAPGDRSSRQGSLGRLDLKPKASHRVAYSVGLRLHGATDQVRSIRLRIGRGLAARCTNGVLMAELLRYAFAGGVFSTGPSEPLPTPCRRSPGGF